MVINAIERMESHTSPKESLAGVGRARAVTPSPAATPPTPAAAEAASPPPLLVNQDRVGTPTANSPPNSSEPPEAQQAGSHDDLGAATSLSVSNGGHGQLQRELPPQEQSFSEVAVVSLERPEGNAAVEGGGGGSLVSSEAARVAGTTTAVAVSAMSVAAEEMVRSSGSGVPSKAKGSCKTGGDVPPEELNAAHDQSERCMAPNRERGGEGVVNAGGGVVARQEKRQVGGASKGGKCDWSEPQTVGAVDGVHQQPATNRREEGVAVPAVAVTPSSRRNRHPETSAGATAAGSSATVATGSAPPAASGLPAVPGLPVRRKTSRLNPQAAPFMFNPGACSGRVAPGSPSALVGVEAKKPAEGNPPAPAAVYAAPAAPAPAAPAPAAAPTAVTRAAALPSAASTPPGSAAMCSPSPRTPAPGGSGGGGGGGNRGGDGGGGDSSGGGGRSGSGSGSGGVRNKKEDHENSEREDSAAREAVPVVPRDDQALPRPPSSGAPAATRGPSEGGTVFKLGVVVGGCENTHDGLGSAHIEGGASGVGVNVGDGVGISGVVSVGVGGDCGGIGKSGGGGRGGGDRRRGGEGGGGGDGGGDGGRGGGGVGQSGGDDGGSGGREGGAKKPEVLMSRAAMNVVGASSTHLPVRERCLANCTFLLPPRSLVVLAVGRQA